MLWHWRPPPCLCCTLLSGRWPSLCTESVASLPVTMSNSSAPLLCSRSIQKLWQQHEAATGAALSRQGCNWCTGRDPCRQPGGWAIGARAWIQEAAVFTCGALLTSIQRTCHYRHSCHYSLCTPTLRTILLMMISCMHDFLPPHIRLHCLSKH